MQVSELWATQLRAPPPVGGGSVWAFGRHVWMERRRTVVAAGHAATLLAVGGGADVLLDAGGGDAALAIGHRAVLVLARHDGIGILGGGRDEADGGEEEGSKRQLHGGGGFWRWWWWFLSWMVGRYRRKMYKTKKAGRRSGQEDQLNGNGLNGRLETG